MLMVHTYQGVGHVLLRGGESSLQGGSCSSQICSSSKGGILIKIFNIYIQSVGICFSGCLFSLKSSNFKIRGWLFSSRS